MSTRIFFTAFAVLGFAFSPAAGALASPPIQGEQNALAIESAGPASAGSQTQPVVADSTARWGVAEPTITVTALPLKALPVKHKAAAPIAESRHRGYNFAVNIAGHQAALDRCAGFVWENFNASGRAVSAHNTCGGAVILKLHVGDLVTLTGHGAGTYRVTQVKSVPKRTNSSVLEGHLWMQTCYFDSPTLRLVRLTPVD